LGRRGHVQVPRERGRRRRRGWTHTETRSEDRTSKLGRARIRAETRAVSANGGSTMSFDALTISGVLAALVSAGVIVGIVRNNDRRRDKADSSDAVSLAGRPSKGEHLGA